MKSTRVQAMILATAAVAGYAGAAAFSAWAQPSVPVATGYGPDDGLTRYVLTAESGDATAEFLASLEATDGVVNAQRLSDGHAFVATDRLSPQQLEALPGVADAEFSTTVPVLGTVTDPYFPQYGYNLDNTGSNAYQGPAVADADVDAPEGWDGGTGAGMIVAVVDTGYYSAHPELAGALWTNPDGSCGSADPGGKPGDCHGWNFTTNSPDVDNGSYGSHGTSVSGVIAGRAGNGQGTAGVAPDVTIMPLVIGSGSNVDMTLGAEAIRYAVDHGANVINASWGGTASGWALDNLRDAVAYAGAHGVLVVAAAGNDGANRDYSPMYPASLTEENLVTVGNSNAADRVSSSSAYGATSVDLFAPGDLVFTTWNDGSYMLVSGTSIAAPQVAAAYALYRAAWPTATAAQLKQALLDDVDPVAAFAGKSVTGGRLSIGRLASGALGAVRYTFTSMTAPVGVVTPGVTAAGEDAPGDYSVALGLGLDYQGEVWAVSGKDITLGGTTLTTDDSGEAVFALGAATSLAALQLSPSVSLSDGRYVLTVQLYRDGAVLGRTFAAPLLVGTAAETAPADSGSGSGAGDSGSGDAGSGADGSGGSGSGDVGAGGSGSGGSGSDSGSGSGSGSGDSGSGSGGAGSGGSGTGGSGSGGSGPGGSGSGGSGGGSDTGAGDSGAGDSGAGDAGPGGSGGDSGSGATPDAPSGGSTLPDDSGGPGSDPAPPGTGGGATFPSVGPFAITSMNPTTVSTAGGTLVTITGAALPSNPTVRIGDSATAVVVLSTATQLVFRTPARVADIYDVFVFARDGRSDVLEGALTYADDVAPGAGGDGPGDAGPGGSGSDGSGGSGSGDTGSGSGDAGSGSGGSGSGSGGSGSGGPGSGGSGSGGSGGSAEPVVRTGPGGERLVRTTKFAALGSMWSMNCASSCSGVAI